MRAARQAETPTAASVATTFCVGAGSGLPGVFAVLPEPFSFSAQGARRTGRPELGRM